jgi:hypothetical protein
MNEQSSAIPSTQRTSGLAIVSLVLGILSLLCLSILAGIPALICGIVALKKVTESLGALAGKGYAVAGIIMGSLSLLIFVSCIPVFRNAQHIAKKAKARAEIYSLRTAFNAYYTEFGRWPTNTLAPIDVTTNLFANPRGIVFYDWSPSELKNGPTGTLVLDPWGTPLRCAFDANNQNSIRNPFTNGKPSNIQTGVIIWSRGRDGKSSDTVGQPADDTDNIVSW